MDYQTLYATVERYMHEVKAFAKRSLLGLKMEWQMKDVEDYLQNADQAFANAANDEYALDAAAGFLLHATETIMEYHKDDAVVNQAIELIETKLAPVYDQLDAYYEAAKDVQKTTSYAVEDLWLAALALADRKEYDTLLDLEQMDSVPFPQWSGPAYAEFIMLVDELDEKADIIGTIIQDYAGKTSADRFEEWLDRMLATAERADRSLYVTKAAADLKALELALHEFKDTISPIARLLNQLMPYKDATGDIELNTELAILIEDAREVRGAYQDLQSFVGGTLEGLKYSVPIARSVDRSTKDLGLIQCSHGYGLSEKRRPKRPDKRRPVKDDPDALSDYESELELLPHTWNDGDTVYPLEISQNDGRKLMETVARAMNIDNERAKDLPKIVFSEDYAEDIRRAGDYRRSSNLITVYRPWEICTVLHEVAHWIDVYIWYGDARSNNHGPRWQKYYKQVLDAYAGDPACNAITGKYLYND